MNQFIESLCRLYISGKVQQDKLLELLNNKKITQQEYDYIISSDNPTRKEV